ncbi:hypothetical protein DFH09DRAFT_1080179 [Mycena vulgaris]|nr:hypothetical protein DFH09DRAFT_1080179 [Mycena vulgaris]
MSKGMLFLIRTGQGVNFSQISARRNSTSRGTVGPGKANETRRIRDYSAIAAINKMSSALKRKKNAEIADRNAGREYQHAQHLQNPRLDDASDVESFITVSTEPEKELSPASTMAKVIGKLSPDSVKGLLRAISGLGGRDKRQRDEAPESEGRRQAKKIREEIALKPGMSLPIVFHELLHDLVHFGVYIPLSQPRTNPLIQGGKEPRILDSEAFERAHGRELDLDRGQFTEAARNYVTFLEQYYGADSDIVQRWHSHFGFFQRARVGPPSSSRGGAPGAAGAGGCGGNLGGGRGGARGGAPPPFQGGAGGAAPAPVCLVCARRGHLWKDCTATHFEDNGILYCSVRAPDTRAVHSHQTLCRAWNAKGAASNCSHDPALRAHVCSYCGSRDHHAFAWSCRRNPPI